VKTAISLPDSLFEAAERLAKQLSISRSQLFQRALEAYLRDQEGEAITRALNELYGPGGEDSHVDPVLLRMQIASLPPEDW